MLIFINTQSTAVKGIIRATSKYEISGIRLTNGADTLAVYSFNGTDLKTMLQGAVELLNQSKKEIDALNVYPVPDGDTGTNMYHTLVSALNEALRVDSDHIGLVAESAARGSLIGARGNSGVILSQILQGFALSLRGKEMATASDISCALEHGANTAYRSVAKPVEGTILTVVRRSAEGAAAQRSDDLLRILLAITKHAFLALRETPDKLPALKQAGVVDAGGKGFLVILQGFLYALKLASPVSRTSSPATFAVPAKDKSDTRLNFGENISIDYVYCTEFLLKGENLPADIIKQDLASIGEHLMVVGSDDILKVHIHTNHPGFVLESCMKHGRLHEIIINNMQDQHIRTLVSESKVENLKEIGIISVGAGKGMTLVMKSLGADVVIAGGQTLNPSTGDFMEIIEKIPSEKLIILPNNKNIVLAAERAAGLTNKKITVVPSKSFPQGISALLSYNTEDNYDIVVRKMQLSLDRVRTGEITRSVRDSFVKNMVIKEGDYIGLINGDLSVSGASMVNVLEELLQKMIDFDSELVTIYYGESLDSFTANDIIEKHRIQYPHLEFEVQNGGQPVYDLIISVE